MLAGFQLMYLNLRKFETARPPVASKLDTMYTNVLTERIGYFRPNSKARCVLISCGSTVFKALVALPSGSDIKADW